MALSHVAADQFPAFARVAVPGGGSAGAVPSGDDLSSGDAMGRVLERLGAERDELARQIQEMSEKLGEMEKMEEMDPKKSGGGT